MSISALNPKLTTKSNAPIQEAQEQGTASKSTQVTFYLASTPAATPSNPPASVATRQVVVKTPPLHTLPKDLKEHLLTFLTFQQIAPLFEICKTWFPGTLFQKMEIKLSQGFTVSALQLRKYNEALLKNNLPQPLSVVSLQIDSNTSLPDTQRLIEQSPNLLHLDFSECTFGISKELVDSITQSGSDITRLCLNNCHFGREAFVRLMAACPNLQELTLDNSIGITDDTLALLPVSLESLSLSSERITNGGLAHLKRLPNLTTLSLTGLNITDTGLVHLQNSKLEKLIIADSPRIRTGLMHLNNLPLRYLRITYCEIAEKALLGLKLDSLKTFMLRQYDAISPATQEQFKKEHPKTNTFYLNN